MAVTVTNQPTGSNMKNETFSSRSGEIKCSFVSDHFSYYIPFSFVWGIHPEDSFSVFSRLAWEYYIHLIYSSCIDNTPSAHFFFFFFEMGEFRRRIIVSRGRGGWNKCNSRILLIVIHLLIICLRIFMTICTVPSSISFFPDVFIYSILSFLLF